MKNKMMLIAGCVSRLCDEMQKQMSSSIECHFASKRHAFDLYVQENYSLVVVDGTEDVIAAQKQISRFRLLKPVPIIALYNSGKPTDRLELLKAGATCCVDEQLQFAELLMQTEALLSIQPNNRTTTLGEVLIFEDDLVISCSYRMVLLNGLRLKLSRLEFDLLYLLASNNKHVFSKEEIYKRVWGKDRYYVSDDPVKSCIKSLRRKLRTDQHEYIQTERGIGYKFVGTTDTV